MTSDDCFPPRSLGRANRRSVFAKTVGPLSTRVSRIRRTLVDAARRCKHRAHSCVRSAHGGHRTSQSRRRGRPAHGCSGIADGRLISAAPSLYTPAERHPCSRYAYTILDGLGAINFTSIHVSVAHVAAYALIFVPPTPSAPPPPSPALPRSPPPPTIAPLLRDSLTLPARTESPGLGRGKKRKKESANGIGYFPFIKFLSVLSCSADTCIHRCLCVCVWVLCVYVYRGYGFVCSYI